MKLIELRCAECGAIVGCAGTPLLARCYCISCTMALQAVWKFLTGEFIVSVNLEIWTTNANRKRNSKEELAAVLAELAEIRKQLRERKETNKPVLRFKK